MLRVGKMSDRCLPSKAERLEVKIRQLDKMFRMQLKRCEDEKDELIKKSDNLWKQLIELRRENSLLRHRLHLPEHPYRGLQHPVLRSASLEHEAENILHF